MVSIRHIFVARVATRLVHEFADAAHAGTPSLIGAAREHPARVQLEKMFPGFANVGSGIVIDSSGAMSKQQDIVIHERHYCPIFSINDTPEATYYPVEGVIAVGEMKSSLDKNKLEDAFSKIVSAKSLKRHKIEDDGSKLEPTVPFRLYGDRGTLIGAKIEEFDQDNKEIDQLFGFILCDKFAIKSEPLFSHAIELWKNVPSFGKP